MSYTHLKYFFRINKPRDLIVIVFHKNVWPRDKIENKVKEMNQFFFETGFKRVVIQQGSRGIDREVYSDKKKPKQRIGGQVKGTV